MASSFYSFEVSSQEEGMGLLSFLRSKLEEKVSAKTIKRSIDAKQCTVNGNVEFFSSYTLSKGDLVVFELEERKKSPSAIPILYEDEYLQICNKPAGIVSEPSSFSFPPVHRLDKETSGVLILTKNKKIEQKMILLFQKKEVHKEYLALVDKEVAKEKGKIDNLLEKKFQYQGQTVWGASKTEQGLNALTFWTCLDKRHNASCLLCVPKTGRMHQLRVHLSGMGHPILGDHQYGKHFVCKLHPKRHLLHAFKICFRHPVNQKEIAVTAPLPEDFLAALKMLQMNKFLKDV